MAFRVDAPAFVPKNRSSASVVATNARDDVDAGATAGAGANARGPGETTTTTAVTATSGDASSSSSASSSEVERELREALEATTRELRRRRAGRAAQGGGGAGGSTVQGVFERGRGRETVDEGARGEDGAVRAGVGVGDDEGE